MPTSSNGWYAIDSAPKDGRAVLLFWPRWEGIASGNIAIGWWKMNPRLAPVSAEHLLEHGIGSASYFSPTNEMDDYGYAKNENAPTHWQPLPAPPHTEQS